MRRNVHRTDNTNHQERISLLKTLALPLLVSYLVSNGAQITSAQSSNTPSGQQVQSTPGWAQDPNVQSNPKANNQNSDPPVELRGITPPPAQPPEAPQLHGVGALDSSAEDNLLPLSSSASAKAGDLTKIALSNQLQAITVSLKRDPKTLKNWVAIDCTITNGTQIPIVIDGEHANLVSDKAEKPTISLTKVDAVDKPPTGLKKLVSDTKSVAIAAVTIGGYQTAQGFQTERKPVLQRYGWDEKRRIHEDERFGTRLVYPGDSTTGTFFFPPSSLNNTAFECPIKSFYDEKNQAMLHATVEIKTK